MLNQKAVKVSKESKDGNEGFKAAFPQGEIRQMMKRTMDKVICWHGSPFSCTRLRSQAAWRNKASRGKLVTGLAGGRHGVCYEPSRVATWGLYQYRPDQKRHLMETLVGRRVFQHPCVKAYFEACLWYVKIQRRLPRRLEIAGLCFVSSRFWIPSIQYRVLSTSAWHDWRWFSRRTSDHHVFTRFRSIPRGESQSDLSTISDFKTRAHFSTQKFTIVQ